MDQICIAKKVQEGNVEFLDFALDQNDNLLTFPSFKEASDFLKQNVGTGSEILDYILSLVESHKDNPRMQEILKASQANTGRAFQTTFTPPESFAPPSSNPAPATMPGVSLIQDQVAAFQAAHSEAGEVECTFLLDCQKYKVIDNQVILDLTTNRKVFPVLAFVDVNNTSELTQVPNFKAKNYFILDTREVENR